MNKEKFEAQLQEIIFNVLYDTTEDVENIINSPDYQQRCTKISDWVIENLPNSNVEDVREFLIVSGRINDDSSTEIPCFPDTTDNENFTSNSTLKCALYTSLMLEEVSEFAEACGDTVILQFIEQLEVVQKELLDKISNRTIKPNLVKAADSLVDLEYVLHNATNGLGFVNIYQEIWNRVHQANMNKFDVTEDDGNRTVRNYIDKNFKISLNTNTVNNNTYYITKRSDGKILKSWKWEEANFDDLFNEK